MGELLLSVRGVGAWLSGRPWGAVQAEEKQKSGSGDLHSLPEREQLERYAAAFQGLAELFQQMPCQKERLSDADLEQVFAEVREMSCSGCDAQEQCFGNYYFQSCRLWYELLSDLEYDGEFSGARMEQLEQQCLRPQAILQSLCDSYERARTHLLWKNRMMEQRMAAGEQILQTAQVLKRIAEGFSGVPEQERKLRKKLKRELHLLDIELEDIRVFEREKNRTEIYLLLYTQKHVCVSAKSIAQALSDCCREKMQPSWDCRAAVSGEPAVFRFVPETRFQVFCGIAKVTKSGEMVSGDNYAFMQKDTGKIVMSLADGMGSGAYACRESEKVIELLEQFLEAGFDQEKAVRLINSCMLLQDSRQMFSTIDLCMIDLYNAKCNLIKAGASATFIRRENEIEVIRSSTFPAGVICQSDYESMHRQLVSGNTIIMMTDGVLDALPEENREQMMAELIMKTYSRNAREYAQRLMERIYLMQKLQARDDMTILIGNIWEKK